MATIPDMAKKARPATIPVQGRLTEDEVAELDEAAAEQSVPVERATMVAFILRDYLRRRREARDGKAKPGR